MNDQETRDLLTVIFEYSYLHDDWTCLLVEAFDGVTARQAAWQPGPELMGIWDIVLHLAAWNENIIERIESGEKSRPKEGAWPPKPQLQGDEEWQAARDRMWKSIAALRELVSPPRAAPACAALRAASDR